MNSSHSSLPQAAAVLLALLLAAHTTGAHAAAGPDTDDVTRPGTARPSHVSRHLLAIKPSAPSINSLGLVTSSAYLYVDVRPPTNPGDSAVDSYQVTGTPSTGVTPQTPLLKASGLGPVVMGTKNRRYTFANYVPGVQYTFRAAAHNKAGWSTASVGRGLKAPVAGIPWAPTVLNVTAYDGFVQVTLEPPASAGTSAIIAYRVFGFPDGGITTTTPLVQYSGMGSPVPGTTKRVLSLKGHKKGVTYRWTAAARNAAGFGGETVPRIPFRPPSVPPGAPTVAVVGALSTSAGKLYIYVDLKRPTVAGDSPFSHFTVYGTPVAGITASRPLLKVVAPGTYVSGGFWRVNLASFNPDTLYRFNATAHNQAGPGPFSNSLEYTTPDDAVPGPPATVTVNLANTATRTRVAVRVAPPVGSTGMGLTYIITGYPDNLQLPRLTASGAGTAVQGTNLRSFSVYGHVRNTVYRFTAQAVNSVGAGPEKSPRVLFYECTKYFNDTGSGCRCKVSGVGCQTKNSDGCSCQTCLNTYKADGAGGCSKCPAIGRCTTYSKSTCACTQCSQFFNPPPDGASCTCAVDGTNCVTKNTDNCTCKTCKNGYSVNTAGGCSQCTAIARCKTYSTTDCKCTACDQYFKPATDGASCQCSVSGTGCTEKNADGCSCKTCANGYKANAAGGCDKCGTIIDKCTTYSTTDCKCTACSQYFKPASDGASCQCSVSGTGCKEKNADGCSCKTCDNGYKTNAAGGCDTCTTIDKCTTYSTTDCKCTACNQYFEPAGDGASCQCSLSGDNCKEKNADGCSCKTCDNGYKANAAGGCDTCTTIAKCTTYSNTDCKCTVCDQYFTPAGDGASCQCSVSGTGCKEKNTDGCSCKTCDNGYKANAAGGCDACTTIDKCTTYSTTDCKCTACNQYFEPAGDGASCQCALSGTGCKTKNADSCSCQTCDNGYKDDTQGGCTQCTAIANCQTYSTTDCSCDACATGYEECSADVCVDLNTDANNCGACGTVCPAGNICQGGMCMCPTSGTCTVKTILPAQDRFSGAPWPYNQWFIRSQGDKSSATIVPLAWAAASNDNAALNTNPPGGITHAVQLVSVADDYSGIIEPYIMYPTEAQTSPYPRPVGAPTGMFNGVLAKTFMTDATMRISYAQYKSHGGSVKEAPAMRLRLYSPTLNKFATVLWEPAYNPTYLVGGKMPVKTWQDVTIDKSSVVWIVGNGGAFPEIPHDPNYPPGSGTCETLYRSIDYMLNDVYAPCAFFNDAVVNGLSVAAANPGLVAYWNSLSVTYAGTTVGWQFSGCPAIANCATYPTADCKCTTCSNGYKGDGAGGCEKCTAIPGCGTYSTTDCSCTACAALYGECNNDGVCMDLSQDVNNCGACGTVCPAGNICREGKCACPATGTCTVAALQPQVNAEAPPYPYGQWFVYRQVGTTSVVNTVTLASQTGAPASLTASPPGGITSALKLVTQTSGDRAFAGFFYPPAGTLSQTTSPPSPPGMFGGVLFKTFATHASTRLQYDWYRIPVTGSDAPTLRLQLFSPTVNAANPGTAPNIVNVIWEPYYQRAIANFNQVWVHEDITATTGSSQPVDIKSYGGGGWWIKECTALNYVGADGTNCGAIVRSLATLAGYYSIRAPAFFDDAYIIGMTLSQSNIQVTGYANNLEVTYDGTTLKWVFEAPAQ